MSKSRMMKSAKAAGVQRPSSLAMEPCASVDGSTSTRLKTGGQRPVAAGSMSLMLERMRYLPRRREDER